MHCAVSQPAVGASPTLGAQVQQQQAQMTGGAQQVNMTQQAAVPSAMTINSTNVQAAAAAEPLTFRIWSVPSRSTRLIVVEDAIKGLIRLQLSYGDIPQPFKCLAFTTSRTTDFVAEARQKNGAERHRVDGRRPDIFATFVSSALPHTLLCLATS